MELKDKMGIQEIKDKLDICLKLLEENDSDYFKENLDDTINERTITAKLSCYLQFMFKKWNVDCEYNRVGKRGEIKTRYGAKIYPDIIIHKRHKRKISDNLLAIEVKKNKPELSRNIEDDKQKLKDFTNVNNNLDFKYQYGVMILINPVSENQSLFETTWYFNGKEEVNDQ